MKTHKFLMKREVTENEIFDLVLVYYPDYSDSTDYRVYRYPKNMLLRILNRIYLFGEKRTINIGYPKTEEEALEKFAEKVSKRNEANNIIASLAVKYEQY